MPGRRKRKPSVDEVVEKREPFGFSILANVDERLWTNMLHRLMNGADIKKEAPILAKHSGCPLAECEDFLTRSFGLSDAEFQDRMKFFGRALALETGARILKEVEKMSHANLIKTHYNERKALENEPIPEKEMKTLNDLTPEQIREMYTNKAKGEAKTIEAEIVEEDKPQ